MPAAEQPPDSLAWEGNSEAELVSEVTAGVSCAECPFAPVLA
jgi:hypothetical protein